MKNEKMWENMSLQETINGLSSAQPEYYDYSDIEPLWKSFAEENDINLTDTAKQLKDAMWCGYRKGKTDAQSEPYIDSIVSEIKKTISETKESGKHHGIRIRENGEMICFGLQLALEIIEEKRNERSNI